MRYLIGLITKGNDTKFRVINNEDLKITDYSLSEIESLIERGIQIEHTEKIKESSDNRYSASLNITAIGKSTDDYILICDSYGRIYKYSKELARLYKMHINCYKPIEELEELDNVLLDKFKVIDSYINKAKLLGKDIDQLAFSISVTDGEVSMITSSATFPNTEEVKIPNFVTEIPTLGIANREFSKADIPHSVKYIAQKAFRKCTELEYLSIGKGVELIDDNAFSYCSRLKHIKFSNKDIKIKRSAFSYCISLDKETLNNLESMYID